MAAKLRFSNWLATSLAIASVVVGSSLFAQSTWSGATSNAWNTATNWSAGGVPAANGTVTLPTTLTSGRFGITLPANTNAISSLTTGSATNSNVYALSAGNLVLANGATITNGRRTSQGDAGLTISNLSLSGSATVGGTGVTRITNITTSVGATSLAITGTVQVGNADVDIVTSVQSGGTLRYQGADMGATTIKSGGSLTPVPGSNATSATFTSLTLDNGSTTTSRVFYGAPDDMPADTITSGSTTYGGTLNLNFAGVGSDFFDSWTMKNIFGGSTKTGDFTNVVLVGAAAPYSSLTFTKNGNEWKTASFTGQNGEQQWLVFQQGTGNLVVVPEPSTIVFAGVGVAMAGWSAWKKRRLSKLLAKA